jgi:hypothetical protein
MSADEWFQRSASVVILPKQANLPMTAPTFWLCLTVAALVWYSSITVYVSIKGVSDIKSMLRRLKDRQ